MPGADNIVDMADMDNMAGIDNMDATDKKKQNIRNSCEKGMDSFFVCIH